ncbi:hypothetical protein ABPG74_005156 [Tetrahymena malaccensis]
MLLQEGFFFSYQTRLEGVSSGNSILKSQILNFLNYNQNSYQKKQPEQDMQSNLKRFQSMSSCQCLYKMEGTLMKDLVKQTKKPKYEKKRKKTTNCYIVLHRTNNYELENEKLVKLFNMFDNLRRNLFQDLIKVHSEVAVFICQHIIKLARTTIFCAFQLNTMSADLGNMRTAFDEQSIMKVRTLMEVESKKFINQRAESQNQILSLTYLIVLLIPITYSNYQNTQRLRAVHNYSCIIRKNCFLSSFSRAQIAGVFIRIQRLVIVVEEKFLNQTPRWLINHNKWLVIFSLIQDLFAKGKTDLLKALFEKDGVNLLGIIEVTYESCLDVES